MALAKRRLDILEKVTPERERMAWTTSFTKDPRSMA